MEVSPPWVAFKEKKKKRKNRRQKKEKYFQNLTSVNKHMKFEDGYIIP